MAKISGAIFDCDGTLVDSMPMWYSVTDKHLLSYGIQPTKELRDRVEAISIPDMCVMLHDDFGVEKTPAEIEADLEDMVRYEYAHNVPINPGALEFVKSLNEAQIPCIIATSTNSKLVKEALPHFGLETSFIDVLTGAEVRQGRDKEYPDLYLEALERLGTSLEETWVFEDAQFAIRTARRAGFHVAAIYNNHDGRPKDYIQSWADIFSHYYENISLNAIHAFNDEQRKPMPEE